MRRIVYILLLVVNVLVFSACSSGISQNDFDTLLNEKENIEADFANLKNKYDELLADHDKLKTEYKDSLDKQVDTLISNLPLEYGKAWATTTFGDNVKCSVLDDYFYTIVYTDEIISEKTVSDIMDQYISAIKIYNATYQLNPDYLPFKTISISFIDKNFDEIIKLSFEKSNNSFKAKNTLIDMNNMQTIYNGLSNSLNK